jgi:hypothetical protein
LRHASFAFIGFVLFACGQSTTAPPTSSNDDAACAGKPVPPHRCVGGKREPRCNTLASGESRWQIDCLRGVADPAISPTSAIGLCTDATVCGAQPAWDETDCVWGFVADAACEKIDMNPCAWSRACKPKPCTDDDPSCNRIVRSKVGGSCGQSAPCAAGSTCATVTVNAGDPIVGPACIAEPACDVLVCAAGLSCARLTSFPEQIVCAR